MQLLEWLFLVVLIAIVVVGVFLVIGIIAAVMIGVFQGLLVAMFPAKAGLCPKCRGKHPKRLSVACDRCLGTGRS